MSLHDNRCKDVCGERELLLSENQSVLRKEYQPNCTGTWWCAGNHPHKGVAYKQTGDKKSSAVGSVAEECRMLQECTSMD